MKDKETEKNKKAEARRIKKLIKRKKQLLKLRKNHLAGSVLCMFIMSVLAYAMTLTFTLSFLTNILEQSVDEGLTAAQFMANVCDGVGDKASIPGALKRSVPDRRDYFIMNRDGNITLQSGSNTCDFDRTSTLVRSAGGKNMIRFYADYDSPTGMENPIVLEGDPFKLMLKLYKEYSLTDRLFSTDISVSKDNAEEAAEEEYPDENAEEVELYSLSNANDRLIYFHYWVSVPLEDETETLYVRSELSITVKDVVTPMAMLLAFAVLMILFLIIVFVSIVSLTISKNKLSKLYFTDHITKGNNQSWFETMGEEYLTSRGNALKRWAVLNVSFANYRNLCLSVSAAESEKMLRSVYNEIERFFGKKKCCVAHCTASNFAAVVNAENEDLLRSQLPMLVTELENLSKEHSYCFQIGVDFIEKATNSRGGAVRREFADITAHYGNASTARETLTDSDESGIAFFDESLVKEQQWINSVNENQQLALQNEEFLVYYQPKYDPNTNVLRGAEALIRWQSPDFGFVTPNRMIPIFEKNGFITEIDHYMITHAARDQKRWLDAGYKCVPVSVNVSRAHFVESDLAEQIRDSVDQEGTPHELIEIELTESAFFDDKKAMISTIEKLQSYGFTVSMDDFGSGYSSLNSLKDMPLNVLKLDAEFFRGKNENGRGDIVVSEAIRLAKSLNMRTVAEGVEIKEQVDFLAEQGCELIQGYYYSKPIPPAEFEERMKSGISAPEQPAEEKPLLTKQEEPEEIDTSSEKESAELVTADDNRDKRL